MLKINNLVELDKENKIIIFPQLGSEFTKEKMISGSNFNRFKHLNGSRLIDSKDQYMDEQAQKMFKEKKRQVNDMIYISEKIDGMNAGLLKRNGKFYCLNRKGYDVRSNLIEEDGHINFLFFAWAYWCSEYVQKERNARNSIFDLPDETRLVFENALLTHSLKYNFKFHDPVFLLSVYEGEKKLSTKAVNQIARIYNLQRPPMLATHLAVDPTIVINQYGKGLAGCKEDMEGIVYVYEVFDKNKKEWKVESMAKYVSNAKAGTSSEYPNKFNDFADMKKYLDVKRKVLEYWYDDDDEEKIKEDWYGKRITRL